MPTKIYSLCYISEKKPLTDSDAHDIYVTAQENNRKSGISGVLLEYPLHYLQYLEGEPVTIFQLYQKISRDNRHANVTLLHYSKIEQRRFKEWGMLHKKMDPNGSVSMETSFSNQQFLDDILSHQDFWKGIELIELASRTF